MEKLSLVTVLSLFAMMLAGSVVGETEQARIDPLLLEQLGDDGTVTTAVVVHTRGETDRAVALFDRLGVVHHTLERVGISQVLVDRPLVVALAKDPAIMGVWADRPVEFYLDDAVELVGANAAWEDFGSKGSGATVLVIDTGIDALHPDLRGRVVENAEPYDTLDTGLVPPGYAEVPTNDWFGHGTHVAGIVAGTGEGLGAFDPSHGRFIGIAPEVDVAGWSILGFGNPFGTAFSAVQGFEYALEHQDRLNIRVITNSWGHARHEYDPAYPINVASLEAYRSGMAVVFAAGNHGSWESEPYQLNHLSIMPWTVSVGAATKEGGLAPFSSRGSDYHETGDAWNHPTITAPGAWIMAAKSRIGALQADPVLARVLDGDLPLPGEPVAEATHYQFMSGTSMSAPMVAGALGLMFSVNPDLAPDQAMDILVETAVPMEAYAYYEVGAGMLDVHGAVGRAATTNGTLAQFMEGERRYGDPDDVWDEPLKVFLGMGPHGASQDGEDDVALDRGVRESPVVSVVVLVLLGCAGVSVVRGRASG